MPAQLILVPQIYRQMTSDWKNLSTIKQVEQILEQSAQKPIAIFKHSTRCGTSHGALYDLQEGWDFSPSQMDFYYLDLLQYRQVSDYVAEALRVTHQSPQIILVYGGKAVYVATHLAVTAKGLKDALKKVPAPMQ